MDVTERAIELLRRCQRGAAWGFTWWEHDEIQRVIEDYEREPDQCECELDYSCHLHAGRVPWIDRRFTDF